MIELGDHEAFAALVRLLGGLQGGEMWQASSPSIERLRAAIIEKPQRASPLDLAVLLRQALSHESARRQDTVKPTILISHPAFRVFDKWDQVGLRAVPLD